MQATHYLLPTCFGCGARYVGMEWCNGVLYYKKGCDCE